MNKKQRVLTIIALLAFVVTGVCHYLALYDDVWVPLTIWKELTYEEAQKEAPNDFLDLIFVGNLEKQGGYIDSKGQWQPYTNDAAKLRFIPDEAKLWFPFQQGTTKRVWNPRFINPAYAMVTDVRMPWFMLGVIYVGLFFLLADRKEKR
jgi:hypothetical protein